MSPVFILKLLIRVLFYTKRQSVQTGRSEKRKKNAVIIIEVFFLVTHDYARSRLSPVGPKQFDGFVFPLRSAAYNQTFGFAQESQETELTSELICLFYRILFLLRGVVMTNKSRSYAINSSVKSLLTLSKMLTFFCLRFEMVYRSYVVNKYYII